MKAESVGRFVTQVVRAGRNGLRIKEKKGVEDGSRNHAE